jgi:hypothetical protein
LWALNSQPINRFYKKGCQEKNSASTGAEILIAARDFLSEEQSTIHKLALPFAKFRSLSDMEICNSYLGLPLADAFNSSICCRCAAPWAPILSTRSATVISRCISGWKADLKKSEALRLRSKRRL